MTPLAEGVARTLRRFATRRQPARRVTIDRRIPKSARQWVHIGSGLFALLLRVLTWWQAAAMAAAALVFNLAPAAAPRRPRGSTGPVDEARGFPLGILLYPLSVLLLTLAFPSRLDIAAAAWGILAFGDGVATLVGRRSRTKPRETAKNAEKDDLSASSAISAVSSVVVCRGTRDKSVAGTLAFVVFGGAAGVALAWWVRPAVDAVPPLAFTIAAPLAAAVLAALVETIPIRLDDNISVPATAALVLWLASLMTAGVARGSRATR